jgi:hypothetical protein
VTTEADDAADDVAKALDVANAGETSPIEPRDEDGELQSEFIDSVSRAIAAGDVARLKQLAGDIYEADLGDLISALDPDERPQLVQLLGKDFDFSSLVEIDEAVRVQLLEDLPTETVAEGVRDLESDDAVYILEDLDEDDQEAILERMSDAERQSLERTLDYPEESAGRLMQTDLIAVPPAWTDRPSTIAARRTNCPTTSTKSMSSIQPSSSSVRFRSTAFCAPSGRCRSPRFWMTIRSAFWLPKTRKRRRCSSPATISFRSPWWTTRSGWLV